MTDITRLRQTAHMSAVVIHGETNYTKGITARAAQRDIVEQTRNVLGPLDGLLAQAGSSREKILQKTVWLADFDAMNGVYDGLVPDGRQPVCACMQAGLADSSLLIEFRGVAAV